MIDSHLHLSHSRFGHDREAVIARAREAGVVAAVEVGWDLESSAAAVALAARHPAALFPAAGIHPHYAAKAPGDALDLLREIAGRAPLAAIGETGLDFYRDLSPRDRQEELFRRHIHLARELGLPLIVHSRAATGRVLDLLEQEIDGHPAGGVLHCFSGDRHQARRAAALGFHLGVGGTLTYGDPELEAVVAEAPSHLLLLETDAPYLTPEPGRRERNEPARLGTVRDRIALLRGSSPAEVDRLTTENAARLFRVAVPGPVAVPAPMAATARLERS